MRSPLNIEDFDSYLEDEVNQHRMYPSDHVWRNIQQELHGYKKWPALTVITLFVISSLVVGTLLMKPHKLTVSAMVSSASKAVAAAVEKNAIPAENLQQHLSPEHITQATIAAVAKADDIDDAIQDAFAQYHTAAGLTSASSIDNTVQTIATTANANNSYSVAAQQKISPNSINNIVVNKPISVVTPQTEAAINAGLKKQADALAKNYNGFNWMKTGAFDSGIPNRFYYSKGVWKTVYGSILFSSARNVHSSGSPDFYNVAFSNGNPGKPSKNKYKLQSKSNRFDVQLYVTPSLAYRTVSYGKSVSNGKLAGIPNGTGYIVNMSDPSGNKLSAGYEVGSTVGYKLNNSFTLRGGLQFNAGQYNIQGSVPSTSSAQTTTIQPISDGSSATNAVVTTSSQTVTNNQPPVVFINRYYQLSMPIGVDWKAWKRGKFSIAVATSLAPSYMFSKAPFIVASNNKSSDGSDLMRKWNLNSNLESYFAYTTGKFKWQIGPQVSYQLLSTLNSNYPIKEHLINYGVKIGVTRSLP